MVDVNNVAKPASGFTVAQRNLLIDGQPLPRVPRHKAAGWAEYVQSLGDRGRLTYLTSISWTDEFPAAAGPPPPNRRRSRPRSSAGTPGLSQIPTLQAHFPLESASLSGLYLIGHVWSAPHMQG